MGRPLFDTDPYFREAIFHAERIVRRANGPSIIDRIFSDSDAWLMDLRVSHPAIFAFQWAVAQSLRRQGLAPAASLGASLGEYVALTVSGAVDFAAMLTFIVRQSQTIVELVPPGGMVTVLATSAYYAQQRHLFGGCTLAAVNFDGHIVVAGPRDALQRCCLALAQEGIAIYPLNVPFGFHSRDVEVARAPFFAAAASLSLGEVTMPVISCVDAVGVVGRLDADHLWRIVEQPIHFLKAIRYAEQALQRPTYVDCSPSGTLANFLRYILGPEARPRIVAAYSPGRTELATAAP